MTCEVDTLEVEVRTSIPQPLLFHCPRALDESGTMLVTLDAKRIVFIIYEFLYNFFQKELRCLTETQNWIENQLHPAKYLVWRWLLETFLSI